MGPMDVYTDQEANRLSNIMAVNPHFAADELRNQLQQLDPQTASVLVAKTKYDESARAVNYGPGLGDLQIAQEFDQNGQDTGFRNVTMATQNGVEQIAEIQARPPAYGEPGYGYGAYGSNALGFAAGIIVGDLLWQQQRGIDFNSPGYLGWCNREQGREQYWNQNSAQFQQNWANPNYRNQIETQNNWQQAALQPTQNVNNTYITNNRVNTTTYNNPVNNTTVNETINNTRQTSVVNNNNFHPTIINNPHQTIINNPHQTITTAPAAPGRPASPGAAQPHPFVPAPVATPGQGRATIGGSPAPAERAPVPSALAQQQALQAQHDAAVKAQAQAQETARENAAKAQAQAQETARENAAKAQAQAQETARENAAKAQAQQQNRTPAAAPQERAPAAPQGRPPAASQERAPAAPPPRPAERPAAAPPPQPEKKKS